MKNGPQHIYIAGISGTGTGSLAGLLKAMGHEVTGSDAHVYPPMSELLRTWGIAVHEGYDAAHIHSGIDQVIIGNVIRRDNPEAEAIRRLDLPTMSMPQAVAHFCIGERHSIVISGTHGKTTTTALVAHLLASAGKDPGYLIGGAPVSGEPSFHVGQGRLFVVEGDEYDSAYFDKGPKFLHYRAQTAVITSLEFDHADIYRDVAAIEAAFQKLIVQLPPHGRLVVWHGAERARKLVAQHARVQEVLTFSEDPALADEVDIGVREVATSAEGTRFVPIVRGQRLAPLTTKMWGAFGVRNALAALGAVREAQLTPAQLSHGFESFAGVRRRMELKGTAAGVSVVDDFAHHPTAVAETLRAARLRWPGRRLWSIFEPRSATSRRNIFFKEYVEAFSLSDVVIIASHERLGEVDASERFEPAALAAALPNDAHAIAALDDIVAHVEQHARHDDVILVLSNGSFGNLVGRLLTTLGSKARANN